MTQPAIRVENIGKEYRLGRRERYSTLRDTLAQTVTAPIQWMKSLGSAPEGQDSFWALKDVSFDVPEGKVVGIIGRNGAGKSTLLKILSRITRPSTGKITLQGRVGSLLEVGTGFHPELTGRENIYLNGAILGMRQSEIVSKFDEIVEFSEVSKFLDTPVKHYSSGMYMRLAFAVAAHLEPEILVVDEVLAVGDVEFQKKCMGKMKSVSEQGRTVLFVSHNLDAVRRLCDSAILLSEGTVAMNGAVDPVVDRFLSSRTQQAVNVEIPPAMHWKYPPAMEIFKVALLSEDGHATDSVLMNERFTLRLHYKLNDATQTYRLGIVIRNSDGLKLATTVNTDQGLPHIEGKAGVEYSLDVAIHNPFVPGNYTLESHIKSFASQAVDIIEGISFSVDSVTRGNALAYGPGIVRLETAWSEPSVLK